jgi:hypothetical protein
MVYSISNDDARQIASDLDSLAKYIAGQAERGRSPSVEMITKQMRGTVVKITKIRGDFSVSDAHELATAFLVDEIPLAMQEELDTAVATRLAASSSFAKKDTLTQRIPLVEHYFPQRVWDHLDNAVDDIHLKSTFLIQWVNRLGITHASEVLAGRLAAVLAVRALNNPGCLPNTLNTMTRHLKSGIIEYGLKHPYPKGYVVDYPRSVQDFRTRF